MDPVGDLAGLASPDPRVRFAAEDRLRAAGTAGVVALTRLLAIDEVPEALRERASELVGAIAHDRAVEAFRAAVPDPTAPDLWAGAVALAAEAHPALDAAAVTARVSALADDARRVVPADAPIRDRVVRLTAFLATEAGFRGAVGTYDDPRNSYLPDVLTRRRGIPVTLALVWIAVAERLGLHATGVGLPLHVVCRCDLEDGSPIYVDAFHGEVLDEAGCRRLVDRLAGREVALPPRAFRPMRPTDVLHRMLRNLRVLHEREGRLAVALAALDRALHLDPVEPGALRDRAFLLARMARPTAAARAVSRALAADPSGGDRALLEGIRRQLLRAAAQRN